MGGGAAGGGGACGCASARRSRSLPGVPPSRTCGGKNEPRPPQRSARRRPPSPRPVHTTHEERPPQSRPHIPRTRPPHLPAHHTARPNCPTELPETERGGGGGSIGGGGVLCWLGLGMARRRRRMLAGSGGDNGGTAGDGGGGGPASALSWSCYLGAGGGAAALCLLGWRPTYKHGTERAGRGPRARNWPAPAPRGLW